MMHSRNSCKTLKCPRCNWHYKYQETLEIHMKEKHPENELNCLYCLTNQSHPRLARGETYTCGYKPYRCEVCNYSTTTKGNLSIHMTSDKHMTNIQQYDATAAAVQVAAANKFSSGLVASATAGNNNNNNTNHNNSSNTRDSTASPSTNSSASGQLNNLSNLTSANTTNDQLANQFGSDDNSQQQQQLATSISNALALAAAAASNSSSSASSSPVSSNQSNIINNNPTTVSSLVTSSNFGSPTIKSEPNQPRPTSSASPITGSPNTANTSNSSYQLDSSQQSQPPQQTAAALTAALLLAQQNPNALEDYINSQDIAKDSYDDPSRKYKCHRCRVAYTRQTYLTAHNKTLFHRKGEKLAYPMEKYLDPNRPFKCDICKESFTQKSILLVHNNSVSHLNKLRQSKKQQTTSNNTDEQTNQQHQDQSQASTSIPSLGSQSSMSSPSVNFQNIKQEQDSRMSPQINQTSHQTVAPPSSMSATNALANHLNLFQQAQGAPNPLAAALQGDPMAALMAGSNPMAALLMASASQMQHPMIPFMMNPQLMAAAALTAAHSSRAMLDPQAAAAAVAAAMFQQHNTGPGQQQQQVPTSATGSMMSPFTDFQTQQQQLMQQAASQLAAAVASSNASSSMVGANLTNVLSAPSTPVNSNAAYNFSNLLASQGISPKDFLQRSMSSASNMSPHANVATSKSMSSRQSADSNLVSSTLDNMKHQQHSIAGNMSLLTATTITSSTPSNNNNNNNHLDSPTNHHHHHQESAQAAAAAAAAALSVQQQKRARTRISEDQLRILRQYFDINNSPTEEQLQEMSIKSELPLKVIKHWFRNTLFKERQKNKDSPYNFNNPPMLALNLEEYERTGEAKVTPISDLVSQSAVVAAAAAASKTAAHGPAAAAAAASLIMNTLNNSMQVSHQESKIQEVNHHQPEEQYRQISSMNKVFLDGNNEESIEESAAAVVRDVVASVSSTNDNGMQRVMTPSGGQTRTLKRTKSSTRDGAAKRLKHGENGCEITDFKSDGDFAAQKDKQDSYLNQNERLMILFNNLQQQSNAKSNNDSFAGGLTNDQQEDDCDSDSQDSDSQDSSSNVNDAMKQNTGSNNRRSHQRSSRNLRRSSRFNQTRKLSPVQDENAGIGPSSTWSPLQLQQQLFDQTWATVNNHLNNNNNSSNNQQGLSSKTSDSSSHSVNSNSSKSKRANRTRFSDQQVKVLQEFFETNAYPKDDDLECLSKQLGLSPRVIVVWFQNARQKARKVYENRPTSASMSEGDDDQMMSMMHNHQGGNEYSYGGGVSGTCESPLSGAEGRHSPTSSMVSSNNNNTNDRLGRNQQQATMFQQQQLEQFFMDHLSDQNAAATRGHDEEEHIQDNHRESNLARESPAGQKRAKVDQDRIVLQADCYDDERNNDGGDERDDLDESHEDGCGGDIDDDEDEFMSAAQMMRQQQQQRQQHQQNQSQNLATAAAAAAGLFGSDAGSLLQQLFAANQATGQSINNSSNLFQSTDISQRSMMEAISNAMRAAASAQNPNNTLSASGNNNGNGLSAQLTDVNAPLIGSARMGASEMATPKMNNHSNSTVPGLSSSTTTTPSTTTSTSSASQRDKRLRTQISPEQLDYLYQKYQVESNPSRKTLESIAQDVGLSKRVVQVWFQNTRARERRGQLRMSHVFAQQQRTQQAAAAAAAAAALDLSLN